MKEDILEQLIEDWYVSQPGWFVKHNIKFRPNKNHTGYISNKDSVNSDIDILAMANLQSGSERVHAVTCKSWQGGFNVKNWHEALERDAFYNDPKNNSFQPRESWKYFRELVSDKWMESFLATIESETGQKDLTYVIAVTKVIGSETEINELENSQIIEERFAKQGSKVKIKILKLETIIKDFLSRIRAKETSALEATDVGRLLQLINAAQFKLVIDGEKV